MKKFECKSCGKCCNTGPCIIPRNVMKAIPFKFKKDEHFFGKFRPLLNRNGRCRYLINLGSGKYKCPVFEHKAFKRYMTTNTCAYYNMVTYK